MLPEVSKMVPLLAHWLVWFLCGFCGSVVDANAAAYHRDTSLGKQNDNRCDNRLHPGLSCCGPEAFNPAEATCCEVGHGHALTHGMSQMVSSCCDLTAYNSLNEICCQSTVIAKPAAKARCCGKEAIDEDKQLCCGPADNKRILNRKSSHHQCCGHKQYDSQTECCCWMNEALKKRPLNSTCCRKESEASDDDKYMSCGPADNKRTMRRKSIHHLCCGHKQYDSQTECCCVMDEDLEICSITSHCCVNELGGPRPHPICIAPKTSLCGSKCYDPNEFRCCDTNKTRSPSGRCDAVPTVYSPHTHVCCDGHVSERNPTKHQVHGSPGQHCCGTDVYWPDAQICCNGHRHTKEDNKQCCGVQAYNAENGQMKCCAGMLYNLTQLGRLGPEAKCCGNILQTPQDVCCISEDKEVLYSAKTGFGCCGHLYYNTSLWSCCVGELSPAHQPAHHHNERGSRLLSLDNLSERHLCQEMLIGTLESVSLHSILFSSVLKIYGRNATVKPLPSPYILSAPDHCNFPKLSLSKTYVFDEVNVIACDSILQSLHLIFSKCYRH